MNKQWAATATAIVVMGATCGAAAFAEDSAKAASLPAPSLSDVLTASGLAIHGYADVAYSYLNGSGLFTSGVPNRVFDTEPNSFNLHQAVLIAAYQP